MIDPMMSSKPVELRLPYECDLSEVAIEAAIDAMRIHVESVKGMKVDSYTLRVGYWTSEVAMELMAKYKRFDVSVYRSFSADAWELHHNFNLVYVRSDGA